jgi:hypothetical protein
MKIVTGNLMNMDNTALHMCIKPMKGQCGKENEVAIKQKVRSYHIAKCRL